MLRLFYLGGSLGLVSTLGWFATLVQLGQLGQQLYLGGSFALPCEVGWFTWFTWLVRRVQPGSLGWFALFTLFVWLV